MTPTKRSDERAPDVPESEAVGPEKLIGGEILTSCVGGRTRLIARVVSSIYDEELRSEGLGAGQFFLLALTAFEGVVRPSDLVEALAMNKSTVSRNVGVLVKNGWLRKVPDAKGRGYSLELSETGRRRLPAVHEAWRTAQRRAREALGEERFTSLKNLGDSLLHDAGIDI